ncbi:MAG TPA: CARDB domain-containing protein [Nitrospiraceae bacterium]|nr:CARDB domain-containing protein [Nitrospiraceae bacterium]
MPDAGYFVKLRSFLSGQRAHRRRTAEKRSNPACSPSGRDSAFELEPLEPRVLLTADLAAAVQAVQIIDPVVPQQNGSATVRLLNQGDARTPNNVDIGVNVFASQDQTFDASDVLLGTGKASGRLNVGASENVNVALRFPSTLTPGARTLLAVADPSNRIAENSEINNVAVGPSVNVVWQFGAVPGRSGNTNLTLRDADGTDVTFALSGGGTGEVTRFFPWDVRLTDTTPQSILFVTGVGGDARVVLDDIEVQGPLGAVFAPIADLWGILETEGPVTAGILLRSANLATIAVPSIQARRLGPFRCKAL